MRIRFLQMLITKISNNQNWNSGLKPRKAMVELCGFCAEACMRVNASVCVCKDKVPKT